MKIFVSAGEVSGDMHASYLVRELKKLKPDAHFFGIGGEKLAAVGVDVKFDITRRGSVGITEALPNILPIFFVFQKTKKLLLQEKPDLAILVDSQGINVPLAAFCKKQNIKTVYYIAPQEWLWGSPKGIKKVAGTVDLIIAIFEKEYAAYKKAGANVVYFGHPLVDIVTSHASRVAGRVCLCPGSRAHEIRALSPIFLAASKLIAKEIPGATFISPKTTNYDALASSELAICASGTINLECAILGVPNIMVYTLSPLSYLIGKYLLLVEKKIKYFSMPNILLDKIVIPELIMGNANPEKIAEEALSILRDPARREQMLLDFKELRGLLGAPGVITKAARVIIP